MSNFPNLFIMKLWIIPTFSVCVNCSMCKLKCWRASFNDMSMGFASKILVMPMKLNSSLIKPHWATTSLFIYDLQSVFCVYSMHVWKYLNGYLWQEWKQCWYITDAYWNWYLTSHHLPCNRKAYKKVQWLVETHLSINVLFADCVWTALLAHFLNSNHSQGS